MDYRMLLCDIDGTIRPFPAPSVPEETVRAIQAVQAHGVKFAISTGRSRMTVPEGLLGGLRPDYWICAVGAEVLEADGTEIFRYRVPLDCLEVLTAFCARQGYPLRFVFPDGLYAYVGYEDFFVWSEAHGVRKSLLRNGEDRTRHLRELPFAATALLPREGIAAFHRAYPDLDIRFPYITGIHCDILFPGQSKAAGLHKLLSRCGIAPAECVSAGDSDNDIELLSATGMSYCVADGTEQARAAAKRLCPPAGAFGVAAVCRELWPEAFAHGEARF